MTKRDLENEYFEWLYDTVCEDRFAAAISYSKLLMHLHSVEFTWKLAMDQNRAESGKDMRYRFAVASGRRESARVVVDLLRGPCSVLEMIVALAVKMEEDIMDDPDYGDRTGQWFWGMIVNLGLGSMSNRYYDKEYVSEVIDRFLNRKYAYDGTGGLFRIRNCHSDLRKAEIYHQMCWYLDSYV